MVTRSPDPGFVHGGNLAAAEARFGRPAAGWLDLSTGINPHAYPLPPIPAEAWTRLPYEDEPLRRAAAGRYGLADPAMAVPAPGSQSLIQILPRLAPRGCCAILSPTYSGHGEAWRLAGHRVVETSALEDLTVASAAVLVNPNNPDGRRYGPSALAALAETFARRGAFLAVDEAFADTEPAISAAPFVGRPGLVVLRSMGKFYGLPGLRLGFALAEPAWAEKIREAQGAWAVSGAAIRVGAAALADDAWTEAARRDLAKARERLDGILGGAGFDILGGTDLFRLVRSGAAGAVYEGLARQGILVRPFAGRPEWLRFGLPGTDRDFARLEDALRRAKK